MIYPSDILPNPNYKIITRDLSNYYLIRFTNSNKEEEIYNHELNQVRQMQVCDPSEKMNDLSTSLLGVFKTSYIKIDLTSLGNEKYNSYCDPDIEVEIPIFQEDFILKEGRGFWVVMIGDINHTTADYTKGGIDTKFKATCIIEHTPMKWNYWHFSIRWKTEDQEYWHQLSKSQSKKLAKRLGHEARANIAKFAKIAEPNYYPLERQDYFKIRF